MRTQSVNTPHPSWVKKITNLDDLYGIYAKFKWTNCENLFLIELTTAAFSDEMAKIRNEFLKKHRESFCLIHKNCFNPPSVKSLAKTNSKEVIPLSEMVEYCKNFSADVRFNHDAFAKLKVKYSYNSLLFLLTIVNHVSL